MSSTLFLLVSLGAAFSEVLVPSNKAVLEGESMNMTCIMTYDYEVRKWTVYNVRREFSTIYKHGSAVFRHFGIQINANGPVTISANSTRSSDAGIYRCFCKVAGIDVDYSAHLIVFESLPVCESNLKRDNSDSFIDGDHIWIQCSVNFRGFWAPRMEWIQHGESFGPEGKNLKNGIATMIRPRQSVTSRLSVTINTSTYGSYYSCKIYFAKYNDTEITTADNVPDFTYIWNSSVIHVYVSNSSTQSTDSDVGLSSAVTPSTTDSSSPVDWYFVSLSLVAAFSIFFILVIVLTIVLCSRFKRKMADHHSSSATKETIEMPTQESNYDFIPCATSDNYETIGEDDTADPSVVLSLRPRIGLLPTPGYAGLMPVQPSAPAVYSRMETYETPVDIVSDSTRTKVIVAIEVSPVEQVDELDTGKTESPLKELLIKTPTYLEVRE